MTNEKPFKRRLSPENLRKLRAAQRAKFHKDEARRAGSKRRALGETLREEKP